MHGEPDLLENLRAVFPGWRTWLDRAVALARAAAFDAPLAGVIKVPQFGIEVLGPGLLVVLAAVTQPAPGAEPRVNPYTEGTRPPA